jgi:hypothetical protein
MSLFGRERRRPTAAGTDDVDAPSIRAAFARGELSYAAETPAELVALSP